MQVNLHVNKIDQQINSALKISGANDSVFQWYLALQLEDITQHLPKDDGLFDSEEANSNVKLPSAPKASFYAQAKHYEQFTRQSKELQISKQPALSIQLINCMHPHSLHWSKDEQMFSDEIIENCPFHTQQKISQEKQRKEAHVLPDNMSHKTEHSQSWNDSPGDEDISSERNTTPTDFFVDTTIENTVNGAKMQF